MNQNLLLSAFQNSSGLFTLLSLLIIIIIIRMATAASIRLLSLNSYSSHWSHHDIGPLPKLVARVHSRCRVKIGYSDPFICFPSLSRFEELSCIHFELRKDSSFHHSVVLVHNVFPQGLVYSFSCDILCMFISSCVKISACFTFIF